jgi:SAM-dependent methyltransferase
MKKTPDFTLTKPALSLAFYQDLFRELPKGKSITRILQNWVLKNHTLSGQVIDLGSGSGRASYYRYLRTKSPINITYTDFYTTSKSRIKINLETPFRLKRQFDHVLCFNTLNLISNPSNVAAESFKHLKPGGTFLGSADFLNRIHRDPNDYYRFTDQALVKIFTDRGFQVQTIYYIGLGPLTAAFSHLIDLIPTLLRPLVFTPVLLLDQLLLHFTTYFDDNFPLCYVFVFNKP